MNKKADKLKKLICCRSILQELLCEPCNRKTIIKATSEGDIEAIHVVLKHYEGYIARLSTRHLYDEYGQLHYCVDETLRRRLETKLITKQFHTKSCRIIKET